MKKSLIVLLSAAAIISMIGCSKKEAAKTADAGPVTIEQWGWNQGEIQKIFAAYKEATGAQVELNYSAVAQQEAFQKLQTVVASGLDLPDIVPSEIGQRGTFAALGIWSDLEKDPFNYDSKTFFPYQEGLCRDENGVLVCLPWDVSPAALVYKKDLAKKYLGTDDFNEVQKMLPTWDSFVDVGKKVQKDSGGKVFMFASLTNIYQIASGQNPAPIVKDEKLNMAPVNAVMKMIELFRDNGTCDNIIESSPAYNASYIDDTHIFYPCAGWSPNYQIAPNDPNGPTHYWGMIVPPGGCFSWGGSGHMIPKDAKHGLEGFKFAAWLISKDGSVWEYDNLGFNMSNQEAYKTVPRLAQMKNKYFEDQDLGAILFGAIDTIHPRPISKYDATLQDTFNLVIENMNSDKSLKADKAAALWETEFKNKAPDVQ